MESTVIQIPPPTPSPRRAMDLCINPAEGSVFGQDSRFASGRRATVQKTGKEAKGTLGPREISRAERELRYANSELSFTRSVVRVVSNESNIESKMVIVS